MLVLPVVRIHESSNRQIQLPFPLNTTATVQVPVEVLRFGLLEVQDGGTAVLCISSPHLQRPIDIVAKATGAQNGTQLPILHDPDAGRQAYYETFITLDGP
jgi:hypothetical protein